MPSRPSPRALAVGLPVCAAAGFLVGTIGTFKHVLGVDLLKRTGFPFGLVVAVVAVALLLAALRTVLEPRAFTGAAAAGVVAAVGLLSLPGPGGSEVVLLEWPSLAWSVAAVAVGAVAVAWPRRRTRPVGPGGSAPDGILAASRPQHEDEDPPAT